MRSTSLVPAYRYVWVQHVVAPTYRQHIVGEVENHLRHLVISLPHLSSSSSKPRCSCSLRAHMLMTQAATVPSK